MSMVAAPRDRHLAKVIRELATDTSVERVVFLGQQGEVRDVVYQPDATALLAKRAAMLAAGGLRAIAHLGVATQHQVVSFSMVEIFDDPAHPTVHCLVTWPSQLRWIPVPEEAVDRWLAYWRPEGKEDPET
jgi:hypothetical protein